MWSIRKTTAIYSVMHGYIEVTIMNRKSDTSEAKKRKQCKQGAQCFAIKRNQLYPLVSFQKSIKSLNKAAL